MLVISRYAGERVVVETSDGQVWFKIVGAGQGKARIGIKAPKNCKILREEIQHGKDGEPCNQKT